MNDDAELLGRYASEGSQAAFSALVERHVGMVHAVAFRCCRSRAMAEDVTQQVFCDLARKAGSLVGRAELAGWLHTSARFASAKLIRSECRRARREFDAQMAEDVDRNDGPPVDWERLQPVIDDALGALRPRDRQAILLRFFQGASHAELADALGVSEDAARKRCERALLMLRGILSRRGVASTQVALGVALGSQPAMGAPAGLAAKSIAAALSQATATGCAGVFGTGMGIVFNTKAVALITTVLAAVSLSTFVVSWSQARALEQAVASAANATHSDSTARSGSPHTRSPLGFPGGMPEPAPASVDPAEASMRAELSQRLAEGDRLLEAHPEIRSLLRTYRQQRLVEDYGPVFQRLGLSAAEMVRFEELLLERGSCSFGEHVFQLRSIGRTDAEVAADIRTLLGPDRQAVFQDFERRNNARLGARRLAEYTALTATPMTTEQIGSFAQAVVKNSPTFQEGGEVDLAKLDWDGVAADADTFLSPSHFEALDALRRQALLAEAATHEMKEAATRAVPVSQGVGRR